MKTTIDILFDPTHIASMSFPQNGQIEAALPESTRIPEAELGAFRAKLRHLRSLGIPVVKNVGSGHRAQFSRFDALTMRLALELSAFGIKPTSVAKLTAAEALKHLKQHDAGDLGDDIYFLVSPARSGVTWAALVGLAGVANAMAATKTKTTTFVTINISQIIREMDAALEA